MVTTIVISISNKRKLLSKVFFSSLEAIRPKTFAICTLAQIFQPRRALNNLKKFRLDLNFTLDLDGPFACFKNCNKSMIMWSSLNFFSIYN